MSVEYSQWSMVPTWPARLMVPLLFPAQTEAFAESVPPAVVGSTVIITMFDVSARQTPLRARARYQVVTVKLVYDCDVVVFTMVFQVNPLSVENSHEVMLPTVPESVMVPLLAVAHTVASEEAVPATVCGLTIIESIEEYMG